MIFIKKFYSRITYGFTYPLPQAGGGVLDVGDFFFYLGSK